MTRGGALAAGVLLLGATGCFRTVYRNLEPPGAALPPMPLAPRSSPWRSFFLYGYLPPELIVDAAAECGGADRVREIRTRQTFTQGLVETFASSGGVNVYSPWSAEVVCVHDVAR
jgi:hypothetical protein